MCIQSMEQFSGKLCVNMVLNSFLKILKSCLQRIEFTAAEEVCAFMGPQNTSQQTTCNYQEQPQILVFSTSRGQEFISHQEKPLLIKLFFLIVQHETCQKATSSAALCLQGSSEISSAVNINCSFQHYQPRKKPLWCLLSYEVFVLLCVRSSLANPCSF